MRIAPTGKGSPLAKTTTQRGIRFQSRIYVMAVPKGGRASPVMAGLARRGGGEKGVLLVTISFSKSCAGKEL